MNINERFAMNLRALRKKREVGSRELSEAAGVDSGTVSKIEKGKAGTNLFFAQCVSVALGYKLAELLDYDGLHVPPMTTGKEVVSGKEIADVIYKERMKLGVTGFQLDRMAGLSGTNVSRIEREGGGGYLGTFDKIAAALGMTLPELLRKAEVER